MKVKIVKEQQTSGKFLLEGTNKKGTTMSTEVFLLHSQAGIKHACACTCTYITSAPGLIEVRKTGLMSEAGGKE